MENWDEAFEELEDSLAFIAEKISSIKREEQIFYTYQVYPLLI